MLDDTLNKIKDRIQGSTRMDPDNKSQLLDLIDQLGDEILKVQDSKQENAESIANFTNVSTYEASKENSNEELIDLSIKGLNKSVQEFEVTHPDLTAIVNKIAYLLSSMGI